MPSYSTNLNLAKPTVGGDTNQWGGYLNTNTDTLDGIFNAAGTGTSVGLQVGSGKTLKVGGTLTATGSSSFSGTVSLSSTVQLTGNQNLLKFYEGEGGGDNYVGIMAPQQMTGNNDYSLVLPAGIGTAGQFLKLTSLSGSIGLLQFADAGGQADNYFASSGLSNKDLGVGLHLKIADTGASVSSNADELVIENTGDAGLSILTANDAGGYVKFGDPQDDNAGEIAYTHDDNNLTFSSGSVINFKTNNTNRINISSGGEILINRASQHASGYNGRVSVLDTGNDSVIFAENTKSSGLGASLLKVLSAQNTTNSSYNLIDGHAPSGRFLVRDSGNVQNTNNSYGSISDERVKQDITDANSQWEDIKALKIRNFKLKSDTSKTQIGVVAQELEASGMNGLVEDAPPEKQDVALHSDFGTIDDDGNFTQGEKIKSVKYSVLYMKSIKALQEVITKIESLESEIDQLKGVN